MLRQRFEYLMYLIDILTNHQLPKVKPDRLTYIVLLPLCLLLSACFKDSTEFIPDYSYDINSEWMISDLVGAPESNILSLQGNTLFSLNEKVKLEIPEDGLKDHLGNIIKDNVKVELKEYTSHKRDLLLCPATVTNNEVLNGQKLLSLKISHNNVPVVYDKPINIYLNANQDDENVKLYVLANGEEQQNWVQSYQTNTITFGLWKPSGALESIQGYRLTLKQEADWFLIGSSLGVKEKKLLNLEIENNPKKFTPKNTLAYFIGDEKNNVVFKMDYDLGRNKFYTDKSLNDKQIKGKIIIISQFAEDQFEFGMTNAILNSDTRAQIKILSKTKEEIKALLKAL
jgi:hypothetical protein